MRNEKISFLSNEFIPLIRKLEGDEKGKWGKMNAQQMVEHVSGFFRVSTQKIHFPLTTPAEHLTKYREFLMSDKPFRENTKAPVLPEDPLPIRFSTMKEAVDDLSESINDFFDFFKNDPLKTTLHPAFGELNFDEWVQLHHKHLSHHLRQFGLVD
jgi:oxepin-CoA hydrolase/3-oxo-5,6-dehydrosuberyl-CoA semialdehyde dehydrogenase